ncbi:hypothetical protein BJX70DRAFT_384161 [Aspergillus crustosus]
MFSVLLSLLEILFLPAERWIQQRDKSPAYVDNAADRPDALECDIPSIIKKKQVEGNHINGPCHADAKDRMSLRRDFVLEQTTGSREKPRWAAPDSETEEVDRII